VVDLPWVIATPAGDVTVVLDVDRYRISGPSGDHALATEPWNTDRARLVAHVEGYVEHHGGTFEPPPAPPPTDAPPERLFTSDLVESLRAATAAAKDEARGWTVELGGVLRVQLATVLLVHALGVATRTDVISPAAIQGKHLVRWRKAARAVGAVTIRLEGEIGWAATATSAETIPTGSRWTVEVGA